MDEDIAITLQQELERLKQLFPELSFRICRRMGRRLSHVLGDTSLSDNSELGLELGNDLLLMVGGRWEEFESELREYAGHLNDTQA